MDLGRHVTSLLNVVTKVLSDELDAYNLNPLEYSLLRLCLERGECIATELAEELPIDASRVSRIVNKLVDNGMLVRRRLRDDRRVVRLSLSEQGREQISLLFKRIQGHYAHLTEDINSEDIEDRQCGHRQDTRQIRGHDIVLIAPVRPFSETARPPAQAYGLLATASPYATPRNAPGCCLHFS